MKPDLNTSLSISGEMSPLPFSMPKLERKLKDQHTGLSVQTRPNLSLSLASKQVRPTSLHTSTPTRTSNIRLSLQTSGMSLVTGSFRGKCFKWKSQNRLLTHFRLNQSYVNDDSYLTSTESEGNLITPGGHHLPGRRKPFLFLPPSTIELSNSKSVDTTIPLENQE